jgi:hypothetical protein
MRNGSASIAINNGPEFMYAPGRKEQERAWGLDGLPHSSFRLVHVRSKRPWGLIVRFCCPTQRGAPACCARQPVDADMGQPKIG